MSILGFIGSGNMAEALIKGVIGGKVCEAGDILVSDVRAERLDYLSKKFGVVAAGSNAELAGKADVLVLSVKPQDMNGVLEEIKGGVKSGTLVVSIAAGIKTANITKFLGEVPIIRVMPNTPALVGEGASALFANGLASNRLDEAKQIFSAVGRAVVVEEEGLIDAVTAVSGSGPAYFFLVMEEMIKAAEQLGLSPDIAKELVLQTAKGAAELAVQADKDGHGPAELRKRVTSPSGTTEAALKVLTDGQFGPLFQKAIKRAAERSIELSG